MSATSRWDFSKKVLILQLFLKLHLIFRASLLLIDDFFRVQTLLHFCKRVLAFNSASRLKFRGRTDISLHGNGLCKNCPKIINWLINLKMVKAILVKTWINEKSTNKLIMIFFSCFEKIMKWQTKDFKIWKIRKLRIICQIHKTTLKKDLTGWLFVVCKSGFWYLWYKKWQTKNVKVS